MSLVYIFAASPMEGQPVRKIPNPPAATGSGATPLRSGPNDIVLIIGGMGPRGAGAKAEEALNLTSSASELRKPHAVLIIGLCGGLTRSLAEGRIVIYTECLSTEPNGVYRDYSRRCHRLTRSKGTSGSEYFPVKPVNREQS